MSIYPTVRPSLTLDFQKSKQLDPRISFSRSSTATYVEGGVVKTADEHQARFEEGGLLIEESRTNEIPYSEDFTHSSWTNVNVTVTSNNTTAPDGTLNAADRLQIGATNGVIYNNTVGGVTSNSTISMWIKAVNPGTDDVFRLASAGDLTADLTATNEWVRYTFTSSTNTSSLHGIARPSDNTAADVYVWGAQFEEGRTFPTSYIPTSGSTVTRSQDLAQITGDNFNSWYNQSEGTLYYQYSAIGGNQFLSPASLRASNSQDAQSWGYWMYTGGSQYRVPNAGQRKSPNEIVLLANGNAFTSTIMGQSYKAAVGHDNSTLSACLEGYSVQSRTITSLPTMTQFSIGFIKNNSNNKYTGHIARLSFYSERLTDTQLQAITS